MSPTTGRHGVPAPPGASSRLGPCPLVPVRAACRPGPGSRDRHRDALPPARPPSVRGRSGRGLAPAPQAAGIARLERRAAS